MLDQNTDDPQIRNMPQLKTTKVAYSQVRTYALSDVPARCISLQNHYLTLLFEDDYV